MSTTPTAIIRSASPRPFAGVLGASLSVSTMSHGSFQVPSLGGQWVYCDHMPIEHNPTTRNTKRLGPGSSMGVLT
jgi:hypothetical protein